MDYYSKSNLESSKVKLCGLIAGVSWTSSVEYYKQMNAEVGRILGGLHSSRQIMYSLNLEDYNSFARDNEYDKFKELVADVAIRLFKAGADFLVLCSNTAHIAVDEVCKTYSKLYEGKTCPVLHIADCTGYEVKTKYPSIKKLGLIGTTYTMKKGQIVERLVEHGFEVAIPRSEEDQKFIMNVIEGELAVNNYSNYKSKERILEIIYKMQEEDEIEGIILGCTELPLFIPERNIGKKYQIPAFDTMLIHINAAVKVQIGENNIDDYLPKGKDV